MPSAKLFLIDAHALCYRAFYAIKELRNSRGQATNAVYGFINTLRKILREYDPEYIAVCFDSKEKTSREEKYAEYKIQRPKMPDDLISQIPIIKDAIAGFKLAVFEQPGYEADDIIATLARQASDKGLEVVIVSDDKDMFQLAGNGVKFFSTRKDLIYGSKEIQSKLGIEPKRIIDFIALAGDSVDNIPGVAGIGEVTARKLINEFGDLDGILKNVQKIKQEKVREKIIGQKDSALLSRELAILETKVPVKWNLKQMAVQEPDSLSLFKLFKELEFRRLAEEFSVGADAEDDEDPLGSLKNKFEINAYLAAIRKKGEFAFLLEFPDEDDCRIALTLSGQETVELNSKNVVEFKSIFEDQKILKVTHNLKRAKKELAVRSVEINGPCFDVMLAAYLIAPAQPVSVKDIVWAYDKISVSDQSFLAKGCPAVLKLYPQLKKKLQETALIELFEKIEMPLTDVLYKMEGTGVCLDTDFLAQLAKETDLKIANLQADLYKQAGEEFNLNSPKQLSKILFEKLKLSVIKKTKTGFSTDESVLSVLAKNHEFPVLILEYRQLSKLKSTYIDALPKLVNPRTGRIHAEFNQIGAETGRLSSRQPNLQNIPIRTELGRQIRKAIIASDNKHVLLAADYSQIELRILAHLSGDKTLIEAFKNGQDIHNYTASLIFDVDKDKVSAEMRYSTKRVNFGIIYGMSAFGLAKDLGISQPEAQEFIDKYFLRYPDVKKFMDDEIAKCEKNGYVTTLFKRRRYIPEIESPNQAIRQFAQRQAINTPVQGSAADLIKLAMINIQNEIEKRKLESKMVITVHDELVFDVLKKEKEEMIALVRNLMESPLQLLVPIRVTAKLGDNWLQMKDA